VIRPSSWLPLGVLALLVGMTWWLDQLVQPAPTRGADPQRNDPDMIVDNFSARAFGEDGKTHYTLAARRMVHYPKDNTAHLERLDFEAYEPRQPRVTIASDRGRVLEGGDKVWFEGNVVVVRDADARVETSRLSTERLLVLPDEGLARTASPVLMENPDGRVEAAGMQLDNRKRTVRLDKVRATYKPRRP